MTLPQPGAAGPADSAAERRRWENFFRDLEGGPGCLPWVLGALGVILLITRKLVPVLVGVALIAVAVGIVLAYRRHQLPKVTQDEYRWRRDQWQQRSLADALQYLDLDLHEDVIEHIELVGGCGRQYEIPGVKRTLTGVREDPTKRWFPATRIINTGGLPAQAVPDAPGELYFARYQYNALFALEDSLAFFRVKFDLILDSNMEFDHNSGQWRMSWDANRVYYRHIENVQMNESGFAIMTANRVQFFPISLAADMQQSTGDERSGAPDRLGQLGQVNGGTLHDLLAHEQHELALRRQEGQYFVSTVNRLRDEWERRQRHS